MKAGLLFDTLIVALASALFWLWQRRGQAVLGMLVFLATIAGSAAKPGPWWAH